MIVFESPDSVLHKSPMDKNLEMYSQLWDEIINKGKIDRISPENFDENIVMIAKPENITGINAFKAYYQNFLTGFSNIQFSMVDTVGSGEKFVKHFNFKGKHTGEFFGIPATGRSVALSGVTTVKIKVGKIIQEQDFYDNMLLMKQLGVISNPENIIIIDNLYKHLLPGIYPKSSGPWIQILYGMRPKEMPMSTVIPIVKIVYIIKIQSYFYALNKAGQIPQVELQFKKTYQKQAFFYS